MDSDTDRLLDSIRRVCGYTEREWEAIMDRAHDLAFPPQHLSPGLTWPKEVRWPSGLPTLPVMPE